jgi:hypothetical protein
MTGFNNVLSKADIMSAKKSIVIDNCRLCGDPAELQHSHLFSDFLYQPIYQQAPQYMEVSVLKGQARKDQGGQREYLLCQICEGKRSKWEQYGKQFLSNNAGVRWDKLDNDTYFAGGIDYKKIKLFALSTLWVYSVSNNPDHKSINLGPHEEVLRKMLLSEDPGPTEHYGIVLCKFIQQYPDGSLLALPKRVKDSGHYWYYMIMGGYIWYIVVTGHKTQAVLNNNFIKETGEAFISIKSISDVGITARTIGRINQPRS